MNSWTAPCFGSTEVVSLMATSFPARGPGVSPRRAWPHAKKKPRLPTGTGAFSAIFLRRFLGNAHLTGEKPVPLEKGHTGTPTHAHNQVWTAFLGCFSFSVHCP